MQIDFKLLKVVAAAALGFVLCPQAISDSRSASKPAEEIFLKQFTVPRYPALARLAGIEGAVNVEYHLDGQCKITESQLMEGPAELFDVVLRTLYRDPEVEFSGCRGEPRHIQVVFNFSLKGEPTNEWSPTHVRLTHPYIVEITTRPPDLKSLGLRRVPVEGPNR